MMSVRSETQKCQFSREALVHLDSLLRAAYYLTGEEITSQNLVQETYLRAYCLWGNLNSSSGYKTRLFRAMTGLLCELYNLKITDFAAAGGEGDKDWSGDGTQPENIITGDDIADLCDRAGGDIIREAIRELPFQSRLILVLNFLEGFSYQEIAETTEMDIRAVKTQLTMGRRHLQKILWSKMVNPESVTDNRPPS